jgi:hypothetical protein
MEPIIVRPEFERRFEILGKVFGVLRLIRS